MTIRPLIQQNNSTKHTMRSHKIHQRPIQHLLTLLIMTILHPDRVSLVKSLAVRATTKPSQRVVLVGGGHAHAQVIKALNTHSRPKDMQVSLIDMQKSASYSGMVPGAISRLYSPDETFLHLEPLADWAGIQFHQDQVVDIDLEQNLVYLKNEPNQPIPFDVVSIDIGSASRGLNDVPGAREYHHSDSPHLGASEKD